MHLKSIGPSVSISYLYINFFLILDKMHDYFSIKVLSIRQCWIWFLLEYYDLMQHALQEIVYFFSKMIIFEFEVL